MDRHPPKRVGTAATVLRIDTPRRGDNSLAGVPSHYDPVALSDRAADLARDIRVTSAHTPSPEHSLRLALGLETWAKGVALHG